MENLAFISGTVTSTDYSTPLGCEIWLNDTCFLNVEHVTKSINWKHGFDDSEGPRQLKIVLKNKKPEHTTIDEHGNITKDTCLEITNVLVEEISFGHSLINRSVYMHDCNGSQPLQEHKFYGTLGCNGYVAFDFSSPVYLWLLENV